MRSAARSAIAYTAACELPATVVGITDASTTRNPARRSRGATDRRRQPRRGRGGTCRRRGTRCPRVGGRVEAFPRPPGATRPRHRRLGMPAWRRSCGRAPPRVAARPRPRPPSYPGQCRRLPRVSGHQRDAAAARGVDRDDLEIDHPGRMLREHAPSAHHAHVRNLARRIEPDDRRGVGDVRREQPPPGRAYWTAARISPAGAVGRGPVHSYATGTRTWSCRFSPTPGRSATTGDAEALQRGRQTRRPTASGAAASAPRPHRESPRAWRGSAESHPWRRPRRPPRARARIRCVAPAHSGTSSVGRGRAPGASTARCSSGDRDAASHACVCAPLPCSH